MEEDAAAGSRHDLGDPAPHLAGSDDEDALPLHGRKTLLEPWPSRWCTESDDALPLLHVRSLAHACRLRRDRGGCAAATGAGGRQAGRGPTPRSPPEQHAGQRDLRADARTLEPVNDFSYPVPFFFGAAEYSPDGARLAIGGSETGIVDIVDLEHMRSMGSIELQAGTTVDLLHWPTDDRILASLRGEQPQVATLQPGAGKPVLVRDLDGTILKSTPAGDGLVLLARPG